jgi:hypothetical protein
MDLAINAGRPHTGTGIDAVTNVSVLYISMEKPEKGRVGSHFHLQDGPFIIPSLSPAKLGFLPSFYIFFLQILRSQKKTASFLWSHRENIS